MKKIDLELHNAEVVALAQLAKRFTHDDAALLEPPRQRLRT